MVWYVVTPEYGTVIPITDEGQGPMEYGCDVIEIEAEKRRDAIALGVREMLRLPSFRWCADARSDGVSPYTGVKAWPKLPEETCACWDKHKDDAETCECACHKQSRELCRQHGYFDLPRGARRWSGMS